MASVNNGPKVVPEEIRFSSNVNIMAQALSESVKKLRQSGYNTIDPMLLDMAASFLNSYDKHQLIQNFIQGSHQNCWTMVRQRDEEFFVNNAGTIFQFLPTDKVSFFRDLVLAVDANGEKVISVDLKNQIWALFDAMIKIAIKYIHKHRQPYSYSENGQIMQAYKVSFFDQVDLAQHATLWSVKLDFPADY